MKKEDTKPKVIENVSFNIQAPISIVESISNDDNTQKIKGMALPAQESRNGRIYAIEDIKTARFAGKPFVEGKELLIGLDHTESVTDNVGKWTPMFEDNGISYNGVAFNTGKHPYIVDMIKKGLMPFVSIEAMADLVTEDEKVFAKNLDILGFDFVKHPGMPDASSTMAEAFEKANKDVPIKKETGDKMTEEVIKQEEVKPVEKPIETKEEKVEKVETKAEIKVEEPSAIDKAFEKLEEQSKIISELSKEVKELKEKPKSKGIVTEKTKPSMNIVMKEGKKGMDIYSEDILY